LGVRLGGKSEAIQDEAKGFAGFGVKMEDLRVAAVIMRSAIGKKTENLSRMEFLVGEAARNGAQVICFPELNISGYHLRKNQEGIAEPIPGPSSEAVCQMAQKNEVLILAGLTEKNEEGIFISHFAAGPGGIHGVYRKIHLGTPEEGVYQAGKEIPLFRYRGVHFGIELCFDGHFPELSTVLALKGAEIIFIPHASPRETGEEKRERWLRYLSARAYDNSVFLVACNPTGRTENGFAFPGAAIILDPKGEVLASNKTDEDEVVYGLLQKEILRKVRENPHGFFLNKRRPELYREQLDH
jgi:predicted amidohydrolase